MYAIPKFLPVFKTYTFEKSGAVSKAFMPRKPLYDERRHGKLVGYGEKEPQAPPSLFAIKPCRRRPIVKRIVE